VASDEVPESAPLPAHIEDSVQASAQLHADHRRAATPAERAFTRVTAALSAPASIGLAAAFIALWIVVNVALAAAPLHRPFDPPPFAWLELLVGVGALSVTLIILATQARANVLAEQRAQLTLQLAMVSEEKIAKVIALIEELRHDLPHVQDRIDLDAVAMGQPADAQAVFDAIKESHAEGPESSP